MRRLIYTLLLLCGLATTGCEKSDEIALPPTDVKHVTMLFSLSGVGDNGYNDLILKGALQAELEMAIELHLLFPTTEQEAGRYMSDWANSDSGDGAHSLLVLASSDYEAMVNEYISDDVLNEKDVLLFESRTERDNLSSFYISMYGTSYLAGTITPIFGSSAAVICANDYDTTINDAAKGFETGFVACGGSEVERKNLSDGVEGYAMATEAYILSADIYQRHPFIFPLAGGSNLGVFRYTREYPNGTYTAGLDVDQSGLSSQVAFSVVKHIDKLLYDYIEMWTEGEQLPNNSIYGIESEYIELVLSPYYEDVCSETYNNYINQAIEKESDYEKSIL